MNIEHADGVTIISTDERLDSLDGPKLRETVTELAQESGLMLLLDMEKTGFIDSMGVQTLLSLRKIMTINQGDIKIASPTPRVLETFELTRLYRLFEIHHSVESATKSFHISD
jgi:anti-sigma B factor antagonist